MRETKDKPGDTGSRVQRMRLKAPEDETSLFMNSFDPSVRRTDKLKRNSRGEVKKAEAGGQEAGSKKSGCLYSRRGVCLSTGLDLCDCLDTDCPGCHFPCPKCGSGKCGDECRRNRTWSYQEIQTDGQYHVLRENPNKGRD